MSVDDIDSVLSYIEYHDHIERQQIKELMSMVKPGLVVKIPLAIPVGAILPARNDIFEIPMNIEAPYAPMSVLEKTLLTSQEYLMLSPETVSKIQEEFQSSL